jgi:hypothetical protein
MCECKGKIEVLRPKVVKMAIIHRPVRTGTGFKYEPHEEKIISGGLDACLICSRKAEQEYQARVK